MCFLEMAFVTVVIIFFSNFSSKREPPSTIMWTLFLVSQVCFVVSYEIRFMSFWICITYVKTFVSVVMQHYDRRGQYSLALAKIDEAIEHTPTVIDLYSIKVCVINQH